MNKKKNISPPSNPHRMINLKFHQTKPTKPIKSVHPINLPLPESHGGGKGGRELFFFGSKKEKKSA
jgi:hypothetical protein